MNEDETREHNNEVYNKELVWYQLYKETYAELCELIRENTQLQFTIKSVLSIKPRSKEFYRGFSLN